MLFPWRDALASGIFCKARDLLANNNFAMADQDALNVVLKDRWREVHPKYNVVHVGRTSLRL